MPALLRFLKAVPGSPEEVAHALAEVSPGALAEEAAIHGLSNLVENALSGANVSLSATAEERLHRDALNSAANAMRTKALLLKTLDALAAVQVTPALLKGLGLSSRYYPGELLRATSDVDLLIDSADLDRAKVAMGKLGLEPEVESDEYYPPQYRHHAAFTGPAGLVELHFRGQSAFGLLVEADRWLQRAVSGSYEGRKVRWLAPEDELVFLCIHAGNHLMQRIAWVFDVKMVCLAVPPPERPGLDWDWIVRAARETGLPSLVYFVLETAQRTVGAAVPKEALRALEPSAFRRRVGAWAFSEEGLTRMSLHHDKRAWVVVKLLLGESRLKVIKFLARRASWNVQRRLRGRV